MTPTEKRSFEIIIPNSPSDPTPRIVEIIEVEVFPGDTPDEDFLTPESSERIEERRAFHMGRLTGPAIRELRERLGMTQRDMAERVQCAEKSLSRWENGRGFPSPLVNTLLRLLEDGLVSPNDLLSVQGPRKPDFKRVFFENRAQPSDAKNVVPFDFGRDGESSPSPDELDQLDPSESSFAS